MDFLSRFLPRIDFESYEDFKTNYKLNIPDNFNFAYDIVDEYARLDPDKPALVHVTDGGAVTRFSFGDIKRESDRAANLFEKYGVRRGDHVMLMLMQRPEAWICFIALCKLGAVCIPATFQLTKKDIVYRCNAANVKIICSVDDKELPAHILSSLPDCKSLCNVMLVGDEDISAKYSGKFIDFRREIKKCSSEYTHCKNDNGDTMLTYFTSGTSGMPKMVVHDFTYPLGHITTAHYWQHVEDGGLHLTVSDSGWAKFAWGKIYGQWICGAVIVAYDTEKFSPAGLLHVIDTLHLTTFCAPPTIYRFLIQEELSSHDFSTIHHCSIAGEPLNPEVFYRFKEATGLEVHEGFGQTESTVLIANFGWDEIKPGSTGKPSPLYDIDIVDENGNSCEDGIVGRIVVKNLDKYYPTGLFRRYKDAPEAMAKSFRDNCYDTGDMAWRDSDGYFRFEGRSDDVIKCSGYRIGPFEVESALLTHPAVVECAVTAVPDPIRGQVVKASVILAKGFAPSDELRRELQNHVKVTTAPYKYPRVLEFVEELPKTIGGKIKRAEIRLGDMEKHS